MPDAVRWELLLGPPPAIGSVDDTRDMATVDALQAVDSPRWEEAMNDARQVYPRFDAAFGLPVTRKTSSTLITLLNRAMRDVAQAFGPPKAAFSRPRPYQRKQLARVCGAAVPPLPDPVLKGGSSYPSGHAAYGWVTAMILARVSPDRALTLLARGRDYAVSRQVCGVHFPSDSEAGHVLAVAVVATLLGDPAFQADLTKAIDQIHVKRDGSSR